MLVTHTVTANQYVAGVRGQRKGGTANGDNFSVAIAHTTDGKHHLRQIGVIHISKRGVRCYRHRRVRRVRKFGPGDDGVIATRCTVQIHHRRIVGRSDGDGTGQDIGILRCFAGTAGKVVIFAVVDLDVVGTRQVCVVDSRVVRTAAVVQCIKHRRHVGPVGVNVQVDDKRFADAGVGAIHRADCDPNGAVAGVLNIVRATSDCACTRAG